jgi:hypothetical protein
LVNLQSLFGSSRKEIWRQLSEQIGASYVPGTFWKGDRVEGRHGDWIVTLDTYTVSTGKTHVVYTRMRAPYVNPSGFRFTIYRKGVFTDIAKRFGMQDVQVGDEPFDTDFVIQGNDEGMLRALFSDSTLRHLIEGLKDVELTVKNDDGYFGRAFPADVDQLYFSTRGVIKDLEQLKLLYQVFAETLERLVAIGSARGGDPFKG